MIQAALHLALEGRFYLQLGGPGIAGTTPRLTIRMNDETDANTLVFRGYDTSTNKFDLPIALQNGVFVLYDTKDNKSINIPPSSDGHGELVVPAGADPQPFDMSINGKHDFWKSLLTPGHKYEIRWHDGPSSPWSYRGSGHQDSSERHPISHFDSKIELIVFEENTQQPKVSVALVPTGKICHLNGEPQFGFKLSITSQDKEILTIGFDKTPLKELHSLGEIAYTVNEDEKEVDWPETFACWGEDDPFAPDTSFEELLPGVPYETIFWLEKTDEGTGNGGELDALEADRTYTVHVGKELVERGFITWLRGTKKELLAGSIEQKKARWNVNNGPIMLELSEPFTIQTA